MKQAADAFTADLFTKRGRGRPRKPDALTPAQRAKAYRARKASNFRDASRKFNTTSDQAETEHWFFPGTAEWDAQRAAKGLPPVEVHP